MLIKYKQIFAGFAVACCFYFTACDSGSKKLPPVVSFDSAVAEKVAADTSSGHLSFWQSLPRPAGFVNDFERIYTDSQRVQLESILSNYEIKTTTEISLVTIPAYATPTEQFDSLALHIARTWGVGKKGKNNGVVIAISSEYHRMKICNGLGIEKIVTDADTKKIIEQSFIPGFKAGNYYGGTIEGIAAYIAKLNLKTGVK